MGLGFLGRESRARALAAGALHVMAAGVTGSAVGAVLGLVGRAADLDGRAAAWVLGGVAVVAGAIALRRAPMSLGRPCQVPKKWSYSIPAGRLYTLWGAMLGSGVATLIPYSAWFVLAAGQAVAGPMWGAVAGALYGLTRESLALAGITGSLQPVPAMDSLERWARPARLLNAGAALVGGAALVLSTL